MNSGLKNRKIIFYAVLLIAVIALVWLATGMFRARQYEAGPRVVATSFEPHDEIYHIGDVIACRTVIESSWLQWPDRALLSGLPEGIQALDQPAVELQNIGWGRWRWTVAGHIQPYDLGRFEGLELTTGFKSLRRQPTPEVTAGLGPLTVEPRLTDGTRAALVPAPGIATPASERGHTWVYWAGLVLLAVIILMVLTAILLRKEGVGAVRELSAEDRVQQKLNALEQNITMPADEFFLIMTDAVREYFETKLKLRATEQTTTEFLQDLERYAELPERQHTQLRDFLISADLVKFARQSATREQKQTALTKARELIYMTEFFESGKDLPTDK